MRARNFNKRVKFYETTGVSDTQRYKMCGNAVTVNVIETIGYGMLVGIFQGGGYLMKCPDKIINPNNNF